MGVGRPSTSKSSCVMGAWLAAGLWIGEVAGEDLGGVHTVMW